MDDTDLQFLLDDLDDYVFEPNAWDFAVSMGIGLDPEQDPPALDELADAMLVWAQGPVLERLTDDAVERLWDAELEGMVRDGIVQLSGQDGWEQGGAAMLEEFDRDPPRSEVAREVVRYLAMQVGGADHPVFFCLCCIEEMLVRADPAERRGHAVRVAILATRNAGVPVAEVQEALARRSARASDGSASSRPSRCQGAARSSPVERLGTALKALASEPLPDSAEDDDVWQEACARLLADVGRPDLN
jgi:hypothetical protein